MSRFALIPLVALAASTGCITEDASDLDPPTSEVASATSLAFTREHVTADIWHYELILPVGSGPNAAIRIHRVVRELAPFVPRPTPHAVMLMHGDFSTFVTNFVPVLGEPASPILGMAPFLAGRNIDVWGIDRRWTLPGPDDDVSDLGTMGVAQELDDVRVALALARTLRAAGGGGFGKMALAGYSHGGQLAYAYAAVEAGRPAALRHVDALVPFDFYGDYPAGSEGQLLSCELSAGEYQAVADGVIDSSSQFVIDVGQFALDAPDAPSPIFDGLTNRGMMLLFAGQTYLIAPFAPFYHFNAPILDGDVAVGLADAPEAGITAWFAGAPPHQSMLEAADLDSLLCGETPAVNAPLSAIRIPLLYIAAAGGIGVDGLHAVSSVSSTDVTTLMIQRYAPEQRAEDFGHADLLFADDAAALVWQPLASWLVTH